jgi:PAS domain S-box-containing protein
VDMRTYGKAKVFTVSQRVPLSAMLSYSKAFIMVLDSGSRIIDISDNFLELLQLSRGDAVGKNIGYLESPDVDIHELLETITAEVHEEATISFRVKGGKERFFQQKYVPTVFDDGGKGVTLILDEITDRFLAEREIRESEERFRLMAETIPDGLVIVENGKPTYANNRIAEITGFTHEEMAVLDILTIFAPEYRKKAGKWIRDMGDHPEKPMTIPLWIIRKNGERRFAIVRVSGVRHHDMVYNFIIFTDITDLKNQEVRVAESEEGFRMMADNIQDGLMIVENENVVFTNRRIKEIFGYSAEEMAAMGLRGTFLKEDKKTITDSGMVPVTDMDKIDKIIRNVKPDSPETGEFKVWITRKDGTRRYIHGKATAAQRADVTSIYITISDITDFAEREKNLRERIDALQDLLH